MPFHYENMLSKDTRKKGKFLQVSLSSQSQWPHGLSLGPGAARLLGLRGRIPLGS